MSIFEKYAATTTATESMADPLANVDTPPVAAVEDTESNDVGEDLPEGEFGDDADVKTNGDDTTVDADNTKATFKSEMDDDEDDAAFNDVDTDTSDIDMLLNDINQLTESQFAIEEFGMTPGTMRVMQITGLLSGTALESLAMESVSVSTGADAESQMAIEALGEKIKEKATAMAAKIVSVTKTAAGAVWGVVTKVWDAVTGLATKLASKAWDGTKAAGRAVKAHPYRTIAAVVAAIAVVGGLLAYTGRLPAMPGVGASVAGKASAVKDFASKLCSDIGTKLNKVWPFGKFSATASEAGKVASEYKPMAGNYAMGAEAATATKLGWSQTAVKAVSDSLARTKSGLQTGFTAMTERGAKVLDAVKSAPSAAVNAAKAAPGAVKSAAGTAVDAVKTVGRAGKFVGGTAEAVTNNMTKGLAASGKAGNLAAKGLGKYANFTASGAYFSMVFSIIGLMYKIVKTVVVGGLRIIMGTFRALTGSAGAGEPTAA